MEGIEASAGHRRSPEMAEALLDAKAHPEAGALVLAEHTRGRAGQPPGKPINSGEP